MSADNFHLAILHKGAYYLYKDQGMSGYPSPHTLLAYAPDEILYNKEELDRIEEYNWSEYGMIIIDSGTILNAEEYEPPDEPVEVGTGNIEFVVAHLPSIREFWMDRGSNVFPCLVKEYHHTISPKNNRDRLIKSWLNTSNIPEDFVIDAYIQIPMKYAKNRFLTMIESEDDYNMCHNPGKKKDWYVTTPDVIISHAEQANDIAENVNSSGMFAFDSCLP